MFWGVLVNAIRLFSLAACLLVFLAISFLVWLVVWGKELGVFDFLMYVDEDTIELVLGPLTHLTILDGSDAFRFGCA